MRATRKQIIIRVKRLERYKCHLADIDLAKITKNDKKKRRQKARGMIHIGLDQKINNSEKKKGRIFRGLSACIHTSYSSPSHKRERFININSITMTDTTTDCCTVQEMQPTTAYYKLLLLHENTVAAAVGRVSCCLTALLPPQVSPASPAQNMSQTPTP